MFRLSPSSLGMLKDCQRCFWLKFNKGIEIPGDIFPSLPSGIDKILKEYFDSFLGGDELPPELEGIDAVLFKDIKLLSQWRNNLRGIRWQDEKGNVLSGAIDNILQKGEKLIVLDFKTRGYPCKNDTHLHYQDQMDIYNFLLAKNGYETEDYAYLLFYYPVGMNATGEIIFETKLVKMDIDIANAERMFNKAIKILEGPEPPSGGECAVCQFVEERGGD